MAWRIADKDAEANWTPPRELGRVLEPPRDVFRYVLTCMGGERDAIPQKKCKTNECSPAADAAGGDWLQNDDPRRMFELTHMSLAIRGCFNCAAKPTPADARERSG